MKRWRKIKIDGYDSLLLHIKKQSHIYFERYLKNYENFNGIIKVIKINFAHLTVKL